MVTVWKLGTNGEALLSPLRLKWSGQRTVLVKRSHWIYTRRTLLITPQHVSFNLISLMCVSELYTILCSIPHRKNFTCHKMFHSKIYWMSSWGPRSLLAIFKRGGNTMTWSLKRGIFCFAIFKLNFIISFEVWKDN